MIHHQHKLHLVSCETALQVLVANLPIGLASVDCNGTETSLLDCTSSPEAIPFCDSGDNYTAAVVLACSNSTEGAITMGHARPYYRPPTALG